mmetsp:Transcript_8608/g.7705  ORF Transcript_8608/g.7705 Transcript_8608/m.7705 type:complete len:327 (+) Transcript_8608:51-1031(+)
MFSKFIILFAIIISVVKVLAENKQLVKTSLRSGSAPAQYNDITTSLIGQYVYVTTDDGKIYGSSVYGKEWFTSAENVNYNDFITTDYTGRYVYAIGSTIAKSDNHGQSWVVVNKNDKNWSGISTDRWGQWVYAISRDSGLFVAADWGNTWTHRGPAAGFVAVDTNRYTYSEFQLSGPDSNAWAISSANDLYNTPDDGVTWNLVASNKFGNDKVLSLETSDFGNYVFVGTESGKLYKSVNHGVSFSVVQNIGTPITAISCDGSCAFVAYGTGDASKNVAGNLYESNDYGTTFTTSDYGSQVWTAIATSKPGNFIYAASATGFVGKIH